MEAKLTTPIQSDRGVSAFRALTGMHGHLRELHIHPSKRAAAERVVGPDTVIIEEPLLTNPDKWWCVADTEP